MQIKTQISVKKRIRRSIALRVKISYETRLIYLLDHSATKMNASDIVFFFRL